jgi:hypothetical protein
MENSSVVHGASDEWTGRVWAFHDDNDLDLEGTYDGAAVVLVVFPSFAKISMAVRINGDGFH